MHGVFRPGSNSTSEASPKPLSELSRTSFPWEVLATSKWTFHQIQTCKYYIFIYIYTYIHIYIHTYIYIHMPSLGVGFILSHKIYFSQLTVHRPLTWGRPSCTIHVHLMLHNVAVEIWQGEPLDFLRAIRIAGSRPPTPKVQGTSQKDPWTLAISTRLLHWNSTARTRTL